MDFISYQADFPYQITDSKNIIIPLKDGTMLASRIWFPISQDSEKFPTILEYLPYGIKFKWSNIYFLGKQYGTVKRDEITHPYFSGYGYICIRVDMRGSGDSSGHLKDEYLLQEQLDCLEIMDWIISQDWSDGNIGMMGISWGGFNSLQVAYLNPKPLKAIITLCSTDDRFSDDIHYKGGAMLSENIGWGTTMLHIMSEIINPVFIENWYEKWLWRLQNIPDLNEIWLNHQNRDDYWKHGSICEDYKKINAAVFAVGGWNDAYKNTIIRLQKNLKNCKSIIGPWAHKYPHFARPGPTINFLKEALAFWDNNLKNKTTDNKILNGITGYIVQSYKASVLPQHLDGFWIHESDLKSENFSCKKLYLNDNGLNEIKEENNSIKSFKSNFSTGKNSGEYCVIWPGPEYSTDQREDDGNSLIFDSLPLKEDLSMFGTPKIILSLISEKNSGHIIVRLNDVFETGESTRISYGILNYECEKMKSFQVEIKLDDLGYNIKKGHRIRMAISNAYFPMVFPSREWGKITLELLKNCYINLPIYLGKPILVDLGNGLGCKPNKIEEIKKGKNSRVYKDNIGENKIKIKIVDDFGTRKHGDGMIISEKCVEKYYIIKDDNLSAKIDITWEYGAEKKENNVDIKVRNNVVLTCDYDYFYLHNVCSAFNHSNQVYNKVEDKKIKRIFV